MPLLLTNEDVVSVLSMADCVAAMERAFRELGAGEAVSRPRSDLIVPQPEPGRHYLLKTWDAAVPGVGLAAVRLTSNMLQEMQGAQGRRLDPLPLAPGSSYVGLVLLFSIKTLELVAIIQDARIQVMRAGATYGIAAKYLAREDARTMGILGSGQQAREQLIATSLVRKLERVLVFSPTRENRERFARDLSKQVDAEVCAVDNPREAIAGADIVSAATTSLDPILPGEWLDPGQHVTTVRGTEVDDDARARASVIVLQSAEQTLLWMPAAHQESPSGTRFQAKHPIDPARLALLPDIVAGRHPGRRSRDDITLFGGVNTFGPGTAYAAVGAVAVERARERGVGRDLPGEWFVQKESS